MKNYNLIKEKIENTFNELKIKYKIIDDFKDEDINYLIEFNTYGRLKSLKSIRGILYFHHLDFSMNLLVVNIYNLDEENIDIDTLDIFEIVNDVNSTLSIGSFLIEDNKHIFYRSSVNCGISYNDFNKNVLLKQINEFSDALIKLFVVFNYKEQKNE